MLPPRDLLEHSTHAGLRHFDPEPLLRSLATLGATSNVSDIATAAQAIRVEVAPCEGIRMKDYRNLEADLMQMLGVETVRIEAPTPGKTTVGVELSRQDRATIRLGDVLGAAERPLRAAVGMDMTGSPVVLPIAEYPHLLIAGRSGGGKSALLHSIICSLTATHTPDELELIMVDPKRTELSAYEQLPHASSVVYDAKDAVDVLWGMVERMEATYDAMYEYGVQDLDSFNALLDKPIPRRVLICDELADLMMQSRSRVESAIVRLGQKGRAAGFHLVLATQSPRVQVVSGLIKANMTARVALATTSDTDSRVILDRNGAKALLGRGDALLDDGVSGHLRRFQTAWTSPHDVATMVDWWSTHEREEIAA